MSAVFNGGIPYHLNGTQIPLRAVWRLMPHNLFNVGMLRLVASTRPAILSAPCTAVTDATQRTLPI